MRYPSEEWYEKFVLPRSVNRVNITLILPVGRFLKPTHCKYYVSRVFAAMSEDKLASIPTVSIDPEGVFKYILIKVHQKDASSDDGVKTLVRGFKWGAFHADIYEETQAKIEKLGFETECVGGGRIQHDSAEKKLKVYGYSQGYGRADHELAVQLLKKDYPDYNISWSNDGY